MNNPFMRLYDYIAYKITRYMNNKRLLEDGRIDAIRMIESLGLEKADSYYYNELLINCDPDNADDMRYCMGFYEVIERAMIGADYYR